MTGKCIVFLWDNYRLSGNVVHFPHDEFTVIAQCDGDPQNSFSTQLREVSSRLKKHHAESVILSGFLPEFICFDIHMPAVDRNTIRNMLQFNLSSYLLISIELMTIFFRIVRREDNKNIVRIFAMRTQGWRDFIDQLKESGVSIDAYSHPFMAADLATDCEKIAFPLIAPGFQLSLNEQGLAILGRTNHIEVEDKSVEVLARYGLSRNFYHDKAFLSNLPEHSRIHRFKNRKRIAVLLSLLVVVSGSFLTYLHWKDQHDRIESYHRAINLLDNKLHEQNEKVASLSSIGNFAAKMLEVSNSEPVLPLFETLSSKLPANTWATSFQSGNNKVSVTLSVKGDSTSLSTALNELGNWQLENQRQQDGPDGSSSWYINLRTK